MVLQNLEYIVKIITLDPRVYERTNVCVVDVFDAGPRARPSQHAVRVLQSIIDKGGKSPRRNNSGDTDGSVTLTSQSAHS